MSTFDFSTLYTKIPHEKLIDVLNQLTDFCFQGGDHNKISVSKTVARWVTRSHKNSINFDKARIKSALEYAMDRCFSHLVIRSLGK